MLTPVIMEYNPLPWIYFTIAVIFPVNVQCSDSNPIVNVALEKPIEVLPRSATCGFGDSNEFILNTVFEFGELARLFRDDHVMKCASDCVRKHPRDINYLRVTTPGQVLYFGEPLCSPPSPAPASSSLLPGETAGCYVTENHLPSPINTYTLWLWPNATDDGLIMNTTNFQLRYTDKFGGSVSFVQQEGSSSPASSWPVPLRTWSHVAVQEDTRMVSGGVLNYSVLINGSVHPVVISYTSSTRTSLASDLTSLSVGHHDAASSFVGRLRDVRQYNVILTNREIVEIYSGKMPLARPMTHCLCDEQHPNFDPHTSQMHCLSNSIGSSEFTPRIYTGASSDSLAKYVFVPELMNDGVGQYHYGVPLFWASNTVLRRGEQSVQIQINFELKAEVEVVELTTISPPPLGGYHYERFIAGRWQPWHVMAYDCSLLGYVRLEQTDFYMKTPSDPWCQQIDSFYQEGWVELPGQLGVKNPPILRWEVTSERPGKLHSWEHEQLREFKLAEQLRVVLKGSPRGDWPDRRQAVHAIVEIAVKAREIPPGVGSISKCDCYEFGTDSSQQCNPATGQCPCLSNQGNAQLIGKQCAPYISQVSPRLGPMAGGTAVTLQGGFLGNAVSVKLGPRNCVIKTNNNTQIRCTADSLPLESAGLLNIPLPIRVTLGVERQEYVFYAATSFEYRPDPFISNIHPIKSFIRGGINLTVTGDNLDSVASPIMQVKTIYQGSETVRNGPACFIESDKLMHCPTPHIFLPDQFIDLDFIVDPTYKVIDDMRRKRSILGNDADLMESGQVDSLVRSSRTTSMVSIPEDAGLVNKENLNFEIYFKLDDVQSYQDSVPQLMIYTNPLLHQFTDAPYMHNPFKQDTIIIEGRSLNYGCQLDDYIIRMGSGYCVPESLSAERLSCVPPSDQPQTNNTQALELGGVPLIVKIGTIEMQIGVVVYQASIWDNPAFRIPVLIILVLLLLIPLIFLMYFLWRKHGDDSYCPCKGYSLAPAPNKSRPASEAVPLHTFRTGGDYVIFDELADDVKDKIADCIIARERVDTLKEVGKGHFGRVYAGILKPRQGQQGPKLVAVKTLREEAMQLGAISDFLREATIMKDFDHVNILRLIGVVLEDGYVYVILPYMENGDLRTFIARPEIMFTVRELLGFAQQAARGLSYLENQKFIHRDVAARNCMVDNERVVKIADFGLARDIYEKDYYRPEDMGHPLPVKWTSPECLDGAEFTSKSDVWSFGVLVWEILTRGKKPYNDVSNFEMKHYLRTGRRLDQPEYCPDNVYEMMLNCWNIDAHKRPSFQDIVDQLELILNPLPPAPPPPGGAEDTCCGEDPLDVMYAPCRSSTSSTRYSPMPTSDA